MQEFIARPEQRRLLALFDSLDWDPTFDYKAERSRGGSGVHQAGRFDDADSSAPSSLIPNADQPESDPHAR